MYNPRNSGTKLPDTWAITYGDQSGASGVVYADKVQVGAVTATKQAVEAATSVSSTFAQNTADDGLLGLAFSSINQVKPNQQTTFFDTVKSTLAKGLFTVDLKKGAPGSYTFGYVKKCLFKAHTCARRVHLLPYVHETATPTPSGQPPRWSVRMSQVNIG